MQARTSWPPALASDPTRRHRACPQLMFGNPLPVACSVLALLLTQHVKHHEKLSSQLKVDQKNHGTYITYCSAAVTQRSVEGKG